MVLNERRIPAILAPCPHVLRRGVAEGIVDIEVLGEPLTHIFVAKFAANVAQVTEGIDGGGKALVVVLGLFLKTQILDELCLRLLWNAVGPKADFALRF